MKTDQMDISIIMPTYESWPTVGTCLEAIEKQNVARFEIIVVDSSPDDRTEKLIRERFPEVRLIRLGTRLLPHPARNLGAEHARGKYLVFTDPDVYPESDWLARLVGKAREGGGTAVGSVACHRGSWLDLGNHIVKYLYWLPGGVCTGKSGSHSANLACSRELWREFGGFPGAWSGDSAFGWWLHSRGGELRFVPDAVVHHHHFTNWRSLILERYDRGRDQARFRAHWFRWNRSRIAFQVLVTIFGFRLLSRIVDGFSVTWCSGWFGRFVLTLPVFLAGALAWLAGEVTGWLRMQVEENG